jgi:Spy/CpxP family protein refolding chaperone
MIRKLTTLFAAAVLGGVAVATTVVAEETSPSFPVPRTDMMGNHGGMMGMMEQMTPDVMKQMTKMVDNCNRMMESMTSAPTAPENERPPATRG